MTTPDSDTLAGLLAECTPGPWEWAAVYRNDVHNLVHWVSGETFPSGDPRHIQVHSDGSAGGEYGPDIDVAGADARLIALAPTLASRVIALEAQEAKDKARIERLEAALRPFAEAWGVALQQAGDHPGSLRTHGPLGALAAHQVSGVHFQRARAALEDGE